MRFQQYGFLQLLMVNSENWTEQKVGRKLVQSSILMQTISATYTVGCLDAMCVNNKVRHSWDSFKLLPKFFSKIRNWIRKGKKNSKERFFYCRCRKISSLLQYWFLFRFNSYSGLSSILKITATSSIISYSILSYTCITKFKNLGNQIKIFFNKHILMQIFECLKYYKNRCCADNAL